MPLNEKSLIARIRRQAGGGSRSVLAGIGDDSAVLRIPAGHQALITTDFSLEGIHFCRDWHSPQSVGHRCLVRGLSDIAAMGGTPLAAFLSLAVPRKLPQSWIDDFIRALLALAKNHGVVLAGGDTAESPAGILADIMVVGSVPRGKAILRSRARPGDRIFVSGKLGGSAYALHQLMKGAKLASRDFNAHFFPQPRLAVGLVLREKKIPSAMIDLSDGLSTDLAHICQESGVGAEISADAVPRAPIVDLNQALNGGEDYELLFTSAKQVPKKTAGIKITEIGRITRKKEVLLLTKTGKTPLPPQGWQHFTSSS